MRATKFFTVILFLLAALSLHGCSGGSTSTSSTSTQTPTTSTPAPSPKTGFEADLEFVKKGQYTYIWVFSRKDGKVIDSKDAAYLRTNAPQIVDLVTSEEGKKAIAGTNF